MPPWMQAGLPLFAAPFIGSFLGVLVRRLPYGRPVALARSECEACGRRLGPLELLPLVSFLVQSGRCRACAAAIAPMHLAIELAALAVAVVVLTVVTPDLAWPGCGLGWALLALAWIDAETQLLPDVLTLPLILAGLLEAWVLEPWAVTERATGAIIGYVSFRLIEVLYRRVRGRDGLGQGDAKLLAAAGAWLGWQALSWVVVGAALSGLAWAGWLAARGQAVEATTTLAFGPMLAASIWAMWLMTNQVVWP